MHNANESWRRQLLRRLARLLYRYRIEGLENLPAGGALLIFNHRSRHDAPVAWTAFPRHIDFMAKDGLFRFWPLGWILRRFGCIPVKLNAGQIPGVHEAMFAAVTDKVTAGGLVGVFGEGKIIGRNEDPPGKIKNGIAVLADRGCTTVPVTMRGAKWSLLRFWRPVAIQIHPPITSKGDDLRHEVAKLLALPSPA